MPMTYLAAAQDVARNVGGQAITAQLTVAKAAIVNAIRDLDSRAHDWDFRLKTLTDIPVVSGTAEYALTASDTTVKRIHSARLKVNKRTLIYARQREVDRVMRDQEQNQIPIGYVEVLGTDSVSIKLIPTPSVGETLQVRVYETIDVVYADGDNLGVPDRYLPALLLLARYYFLIDRDANDPRAEAFLQKAEQKITQAIADDVGTPDEDVRWIPTSEWGGSTGPDPVTDTVGWDW